MFIYRKFLLVISFASIVWFFPKDALPDKWANSLYEYIGEPKFVPKSDGLEVMIEPLDVGKVCPPRFAEWRKAHTIAGVDIRASASCVPDNPYDVAVAVLGGNNVGDSVLKETLFNPDAVEKSDDRDGDGDPDLIKIRLEVMELNGHSPDMDQVVPQFEIAPGLTPGAWVFAPKGRGMTTVNFESNMANRNVRLPAPVIRVEQGDTVELTLENTHYLPHTIHLHGVDHPFQRKDGGGGNDGVPLFSERPVEPGAARTYVFTPREPGTGFYHCHVQPHTHILMGLQGMLIVEEEGRNNVLQTLNIGGGEVRAPSRGVSNRYSQEYDLHYFELDKNLNNRIQGEMDPRLISRSIHREYNVTQRVPQYFLLNGRSFPYTLLESMVMVRQGETALLRTLNGGSEGMALHFHGHKPKLLSRDGVPMRSPSKQDVFWIPPASRADLVLDTTNNGLDSFGAGIWMLHDHREKAVTTDGIGPGGNVSMVIYDEHVDESGLPQTISGVEGLSLFFNEAYYRGEIPVFTGMGMPYLDEPATFEKTYVRWFFFAALVVFLLAAFWPQKRSSW